MMTGYFVCGLGIDKSKRKWPLTYIVRVTDRLLGELYCTSDEAFSLEELKEIQQKPASRFSTLREIDNAEIPSIVRLQLAEIVSAVTMED